MIIVAVLGGSLLAVRYLRPSRETRPVVAPSARSGSSSTSVKLGAAPAHALGNPDAPVMLEEFGDFECVSCASLHPVLKALKTEFGGRLVIVFREFPLVSVHPHAMKAAQAGEAAGLQGKFWEMHGLLYENQKTWHEAPDPKALFDEYATRIGLDMNRFRQDIAGEQVKRRIDLDIERARWIGVDGTPTVFLNGREVPIDSLTLEKLRALINTQ